MKRQTQKIFQLQLTYKEADILLSLLDDNARAWIDYKVLDRVRRRLARVMNMIGGDE